MKKIAGIDTGSQSLECRIAGEPESVEFANTAKGHLKLLKVLRKKGVELVVMESTGGYERALCRVLWAAEMVVSVLNPAWVRSFAKSEGRYAKNDALDAAILVKYGERMDPRPTPPIPEEIERLRILLTRREQLLDMLVKEKNHEKAPCISTEVRSSIRSVRKVIQAQIKQTDALIHDIINSSPAMKPRAELLRQRTGVGPVLMATLIADMPELGFVRRNVASALIGVAPFDADSATHSGNRKIAGGRARPRRALYMATLTAIRHDKITKDFYKRLLARGKPRKVAIVACMRKFIIHLNSVLKQNPHHHFMTTNA